MSLYDHLPADDGEITERRLLQSIVEVARHVFDSAAASVFLVDPDTGELVFEAVSGEGEGHLLGTRFPPGTGIAGWVAASGQPMIADDVGVTPQFAHDAAESTGYVPNSIMAAPLIRHERCIGVLEVLDRAGAAASARADGAHEASSSGHSNGSSGANGTSGSGGSGGTGTAGSNGSNGSGGGTVGDGLAGRRGELADVHLLGLIATQAAYGLELLLRLRDVNASLSPAGDVHELLQRISDRVHPGTSTHPQALKLLAVAEELLH
ncbi:hypothetical protein Sme01_42090 [Sphaerisporangium melleum]|uniref:GAF domain-containing protein n=1 Tax=Sphaerisporangium melleum TaxID=321316 RepID=A0A917RJY9_9ACTN|nr:GAF domain-containing protein [Sphaerisporangium melleum]GGL11410.1 hypothetical protein GCM10007964_61940 [Sphaerisporangium melleum]GII71733.1 hypothetical protein Sme01_42090 [Sphaerisporangium melleum]